MQTLRFAFGFLTILPVGRLGEVDGRTIARSLAFYPLVGFCLGALLAGLAWILQASPYNALNGALIVALWIVCTRALHLDGLMDSFDGLLSGQDRLRKLEIMKDSRVGAMGAIALVIIMMLKWSGVAALAAAGQYWVLIAAPAFGRCMMLPAMLLYPYARREKGLGQAFTGSAGRAWIILAWLLLAGGLYWLDSLNAWQVLVVSLLAAALPMQAMASSLGGHTGDTYGALCEMSETIFLIVALLVPVLSAGW